MTTHEREPDSQPVDESRRDGTTQPVNSQLESSGVTSVVTAELTEKVTFAHARAVEEYQRLAHEADVALKALRTRAPQSRADAILRFREYQRNDPHPNIPPGTMTSAAVCTYIADVGILHPFSFAREDLQVASLDLPLLGRAVLWDENLKEKEVILTEGDLFHLPPNAIAFVTLEPYIQLPDYIAIRFNLRVRNVYRGLLLGTGPLVDPGYQGRLAFPLHNLTNHEYTFEGGERIVSVEFTKLQTVQDRGGEPGIDGRSLHGLDTPFVVPFREPRNPHPDDRRDDPIRANFRKVKLERVESSLPGLGAKVEQQSRIVSDDLHAQNQRIAAATRWFTIAGAVAVLGILVPVIALVWQAQSEMRSVAAHERELVNQITVTQQKSVTDSLAALQQRLLRTEQAVCATAAATDTSKLIAPPVAKLCR